jgi:hypothetical protein
MARYDFGMTLEEFGKTTPGQFMALIKRQNNRFRRECYLAGVTASMIANVNRPDQKAKYWTPWDFVPDPERANKRNDLKSQIMKVFGAMMEFNASPSAMDSARERIVAKLTKQGHTDVEEVFDEVFPHWEKKVKK